MNPVLFLFGSDVLFCTAEHRTAVLNFCLYESISYCDFQCDEEGNVTFRCSLRDSKRLRRRAERHGVPLARLSSRGIPALLIRYRKRAGLLLGSVFALVLVILAQRFVWDVRIVGNTSLTESEVLSELKECGFGVGTYIPSVRSAELENRLLIASDRIAWISLYLDGTVATVQIIEGVQAPEEPPIKQPANLIAAADGQIELVELYRGNVVVKIGQAVRKGDLLVSGVYGDENTPIRYTRAAGKVLARTEKKICIEIPLSYEQKVYGEAKCGEIVLNFFDFSLKIFKNTGNSISSYDIIETDATPSLPLRHPLPVELTVSQILPYTVRTATRTPEEASALAYAELERSLAQLSDETQLLQKRITVTVTDTAVVLECTLECIEDIAVQHEFEIAELP